MKTFDFLNSVFDVHPEAAQSGEQLAEVLLIHPDTLKRVCAYLLEDKETLQHVIELLK